MQRLPKEKEVIYANYIHPESAKAIKWIFWRRRAIRITISAVILAVLFLFWNRKLTKEIRTRERAERELLEIQRQLKTKSEDLRRHVEEAELLNHRLSAANRELESFSYSVSHDLRAPIRRVKTFTEMLESEASSVSGDAREFINAIGRESQRMEELIDALLNFARVGRNELELQPIDLKEMVKTIAAELSQEARNRQIAWKINNLPAVEADPKLLNIALVNLISNAVKFTRTRSPAEIEVGTQPADPQALEHVLFVRDNGVGFNMKNADKLFGVFQRFHSSTEYPGTGIGLATVQRIIQRHGGRVWAESDVGKGAAFYFTLPRRRTAQNVTQSQPKI